MGLLQPLPIPAGKLEYCTIDLMTDLPAVNGYKTLMVLVYKFGKLSSLVLCRAGEGQLTALQVA